MASSEPLHRRILSESVRWVTGDPHSSPRPGQAMLCDDIATAMAGEESEDGSLRRGRCLSIGSTGIGKSLAYLSPAMARAAEHGERVVVSTESKSLQAQIVGKDAPTVSGATEQLTGRRIQVSVLKGWSNFACTSAAVSTAREILDDDRDESYDLEELIDLLEYTLDQADEDEEVEVAGFRHKLADLAPLVLWALTDGDSGDRDSYEGSVDDRSWRCVSVSKEECFGSACPFVDVCKPEAARQKASEADVIVTNHSMAAIQAAHRVPVVLGSQRLGAFHHLVFDEAHTLPAKVRDHGARSISPGRVRSVVSSVGAVLTDKRSNSGLFDAGEKVAEAVGEELLGKLRGKTDVITQNDGDDPLADSGDLLAEWIYRAQRRLPSLRSTAGQLALQRSLRRARARLQSLTDDLALVREHSAHYARWIAPVNARRPGKEKSAEACLSPVDVSGTLNANLWTADDIRISAEDLDGDDERWQIGEREWLEPFDAMTDDAPRYKPSVTCVSGTFPPGFAREIGLSSTRPADYPSPFDAAYEQSLLYLPALASDDVAELRDPNRIGKAVLDTSRHPEWAKLRIEQLVRDNNGSALVLAATSKAGHLYVKHLRKALAGTGIRVLSQWDGIGNSVTSVWRDDTKAVLVGTRSLMTGTDAKGQTCSLVVLDRVPRAAPNPVDDARVEALAEALEASRWDADRLIYGGDAALLLEQAAGRLIRSVTDGGVFACLDPRLVKGGAFSYNPKTRATYLKALRRFPNTTHHLDEVRDFLRQR